MAGNRFTQRRVQDKYEALSMNEMLTPINAMQQKHNNLSDNTGVLSDSMILNNYLYMTKWLERL